MAERAQEVTYRIVIDTLGLAAQAAAARRILQGIADDDRIFTQKAIDNANKLAEAQRKAGAVQQENARALREAAGRNDARLDPATFRSVNDRLRTDPGHGTSMGQPQSATLDAASAARIAQAISASDRNYHPVLDAILASLNKLPPGDAAGGVASRGSQTGRQDDDRSRPPEPPKPAGFGGEKDYSPYFDTIIAELRNCCKTQRAMGGGSNRNNRNNRDDDRDDDRPAPRPTARTAASAARRPEAPAPQQDDDPDAYLRELGRENVRLVREQLSKSKKYREQVAAEQTRLRNLAAQLSDEEARVLSEQDREFRGLPPDRIRGRLTALADTNPVTDAERRAYAEPFNRRNRLYMDAQDSASSGGFPNRDELHEEGLQAVERYRESYTNEQHLDLARQQIQQAERIRRLTDDQIRRQAEHPRSLLYGLSAQEARARLLAESHRVPIGREEEAAYHRPGSERVAAHQEERYNSPEGARATRATMESAEYQAGQAEARRRNSINSENNSRRRRLGLPETGSPHFTPEINEVPDVATFGPQRPAPPPSQAERRQAGEDLRRRARLLLNRMAQHFMQSLPFPDVDETGERIEDISLPYDGSRTNPNFLRDPLSGGTDYNSLRRPLTEEQHRRNEGYLNVLALRHNNRVGRGGAAEERRHGARVREAVEMLLRPDQFVRQAERVQRAYPGEYAGRSELLDDGSAPDDSRRDLERLLRYHQLLEPETDEEHEIYRRTYDNPPRPVPDVRVPEPTPAPPPRSTGDVGRRTPPPPPPPREAALPGDSFGGHDYRPYFTAIIAELKKCCAAKATGAGSRGDRDGDRNDRRDENTGTAAARTSRRGNLDQSIDRGDIVDLDEVIERAAEHAVEAIEPTDEERRREHEQRAAQSEQRFLNRLAERQREQEFRDQPVDTRTGVPFLHPERPPDLAQDLIDRRNAEADAGLERDGALEDYRQDTARRFLPADLARLRRAFRPFRGNVAGSRPDADALDAIGAAAQEALLRPRQVDVSDVDLSQARQFADEEAQRRLREGLTRRVEENNRNTTNLLRQAQYGDPADFGPIRDAANRAAAEQERLRNLRFPNALPPQGERRPAFRPGVHPGHTQGEIGELLPHPEPDIPSGEAQPALFGTSGDPLGELADALDRNAEATDRSAIAQQDANRRGLPILQSLLRGLDRADRDRQERNRHIQFPSIRATRRIRDDGTEEITGRHGPNEPGLGDILRDVQRLVRGREVNRVLGGRGRRDEGAPGPSDAQYLGDTVANAIHNATRALQRRLLGRGDVESGLDDDIDAVRRRIRGRSGLLGSLLSGLFGMARPAQLPNIPAGGFPYGGYPLNPIPGFGGVQPQNPYGARSPGPPSTMGGSMWSLRPPFVNPQAGFMGGGPQAGNWPYANVPGGNPPVGPGSGNQNVWTPQGPNQQSNAIPPSSQRRRARGGPPLLSRLLGGAGGLPPGGGGGGPTLGGGGGGGPTPGGGGFFTNLTRVLGQDVVERASRAWRYWQVILAAILTIFVALIPVIAATTAAAGALLASVTAAAGGLVAFGVAAVATFKDLTEAIEKYRKTGEAIPEQFKGAYAAFRGLESAFTAFKVATQGPVLVTFTEGLRAVSGLLPRLAPLANAVANAITQTIGELDTAIKGPAFEGFLTFLEEEGPRAVRMFTLGFADLLGGVGELAVSFQPFIFWFLNGFRNMAEGFREWAVGLRDSEAFREFMDYAMQVGPEVLATIGALFTLLKNLGVAFAPIGEALLAFIRVLAELSDAIPAEALQAGAVALTLWLISGRLAIIIRALGSAFLFLGGAVKAATASLLAGTASLGRIATIGVIIGRLATVIGVLTAALKLASDAWDTYKDAQGRAKQNADTERGAIERLAEDLDENDGRVSQQFQADQAKLINEKKLKAEKRFTNVDRFIRGDPGKDTTIGSELDRYKIDKQVAIQGASGDVDARAQTLAAFDKAIEQKELERRTTSNREDRDKVEGELNQLKRARDEYKRISPSIDAATEARKRFADTSREDAAALAAATAAAERWAAVLDSIAQKTDKQNKIQAALDAKKTLRDTEEDLDDALRDDRRLKIDVLRDEARALQRVKDAEDAYTEAVRRSAEATKAVTLAREAAQAKLMEYRDTLRDIPLDEESARIAEQRALENLQRVMNDASATALDRREALLNYQRSKNNTVDTIENNEIKRIEAERGIAKGVEGSDEVLAALRAERDAKKDVAAADRARTDAAIEYDRLIEDNKEKQEESTRRVNDLKQAALDAATNFDKLAAATGWSTAQLEAFRLKQAEIDRNMKINFELAGNDPMKQLRAVLIAIKAANLLTLYPNMTVKEATDLATSQLPGELKTDYERQKDFNLETGRIAAGGPVEGRGTGISDDVPALLSVGEHVWTAAETMAIGGHKVLEAVRGAVVSGKFTRDDAITFLGAAAAPFRAGGAVKGFAAGGAVRRFEEIDPAVLYQALNTTVATRTSIPITARSAVPAQSTVNRSMSMGDITINNPIREPAGDSLYRSVRRLAYEYEG